MLRDMEELQFAKNLGTAQDGTCGRCARYLSLAYKLGEGRYRDIEYGLCFHPSGVHFTRRDDCPCADAYLLPPHKRNPSGAH